MEQLKDKFIYKNKDTTYSTDVDDEVFLYNDVKEAVLQFREYVLERTSSGLFGDNKPISIQEILEKHNELFGRFD